MTDTIEMAGLKQLVKAALAELLREEPGLAATVAASVPAPPAALRVAEPAPEYRVTPRRELEEYFDFTTPEAIRLHGHRIWLEDILYEYIYNALSPDELATRFPTLTHEEIYAVLLYYCRNKAEMEQYLVAWLDHGQRVWEEQQRNPTPAMLKLRRLRAERDALQAQQATAAPR